MIHFRKPIRLQFNRSLQEQPDIHARFMSRYPQGLDKVSSWFNLKFSLYTSFRSARMVLCLYFWYVFIITLHVNFADQGLAVTFAFACICIQVWPTEMTIWALVIALLICKFCLNRVDKRLHSSFSSFLFNLSTCVRRSHRNDSSCDQSSSGSKVGPCYYREG
jgi:hypothetical protein